MVRAYVYTTDGTNVLCSLADTNQSNVVPCSHEEADTHLFLHASDAVRKGLSVRTVDTDIVIFILNEINPDLSCVAPLGACMLSGDQVTAGLDFFCIGSLV